MAELGRPPAGRPDIVFVVLDDVGFADLGCYGSEIRTPNFDRLAAGGLRYNNFHTTTLCSPTRACLLTGRNHHSVGMRYLANVDMGRPSGRGTITHRAATVAEILLDAGWSTLAVGKWHLAPIVETSAVGPFDQWPLGRGFERFYGFMDGGTDQFYPDLARDNHRVEPPRTPEEGYHLSQDLVDEAIQFLSDQVSLAPEKPFFLYFAFGAAHFPHHAPRDYVERYRGAYDRGWDVLREERFARQKAIGLIPPDTVLPPRNPGVQAWAELTADQRAVAARLQEAYAGFLEHTDQQFGRLLDFLASVERLRNTLIVLLSDNGASPEGGPDGTLEMIRFFNQLPSPAGENLARVDDIGGPRSYPNYPWGWAQTSNTPLRRYKHNTHGGGVRDPLIVHWPARIPDPGAIRTQFHHVVDIAPTVLDVLHLAPPDVYRGVPQMPLHGTSLAYTLDDPVAPTRKDIQYFEMEGHRGIWREGWKAVTYHRSGTPYTGEDWELFHLDEDFSEAHDLAHARPDMLRQLVDSWWVEAGKYDVLPLDDRPGAVLFASPPPPGSVIDRRRFVYLAGTSHIPPQAAPPTHDVSYAIIATVDRPHAGSEGMLVSYGSSHSGYALYVQSGRLVHTYNWCGTHYTVTSDRPVPTGRSTLEFRFTKTGHLRGQGALFIDGQAAGSCDMPRTLSRISLESLRVGRGGMSAITSSYAGGFAFDGQIHSVVYELGDDHTGGRDVPPLD